MKGLEITTIKYSEIRSKNFDFRIDSEYFKKEYLKFFDSDNGNNQILGNFATVKGGKRLPLGENFADNGTHYIRAEDVKNTFVDYENSPKISKKVYEQIKSYQTKKNDVLLTIVGNSIGDIGFVQFDLDICNLTENCVRLVSNNVNPSYLFVYFLSKFGQMQINREKVGTAQPKLAIERIRRFKVYKPTETFQSQIESIVKSAHAKLEESKSLYSQAEDLLLGELGLKDWQPKNTLHTTKKFSDFAQSGRLDAEYYQPKYDDLFEKLSCLNCKRLGKIVSIKKSFDPGSDAYQETGIPFIRVSDISKDGIEKTELHLSPIDFDIPELKPKKDTILFSKDGSIGIAYKVQSDLNVFTSGALLHLVTTDSSILPDYLTLVLNSVVVKLQAERDSNGAIIQHWKPSDIENVIIPILPESIQTKIASLIQQSFECKAQSKQLLEDAKRMVEAEIEKN